MRVNNFDFLRSLFALLVVIAHCYPLSGNDVSSQWIFEITNKQIELSNIGLNGFFIISGYLIFQSLVHSENLIEFYFKRILRLFPALVAILFLTTFLGYFVYDGPSLYFYNRDIYTYFLRNISIFNLQYGIKGIFEHNPYPSAINGSLWTIAYELTMYIFISGLFWFRKNTKLVQILIFICFGLMFIIYVFLSDKIKSYSLFDLQGSHLLNLGTFFVCGSLLASLKIEHFKNKKYLFLIACLILILSIYFQFYNQVKHIVLPILILIIALEPLLIISSFGKIGDPSYGIYIYGFPIQQTLIYYFRMNTLWLIITSVIISIFCGYISWHMIEKFFLKYKDSLKLRAMLC